MRIAFSITLILLISFLITSCDKADGLLDPTYFFGKFHGITYTDDQGNILKEDPNDWFYDHDSLGFPIPEPTSFQFYPAFPNPIIESCLNFSFNLSEDSHVVINIESENGIVKNLRNEYLLAGKYFIMSNLTDNNNQHLQPGVYRCILEMNGEKYYGDIWIKEE